MKFSEKKAAALAEAHGISPITLRVWRKRGYIPDRYAETEQRVGLYELLPAEPIKTALEKYGAELRRLLESRTFRPGQNESYYRRCLYSLCSDVKKIIASS